MPISSKDIVPLSHACARFTELAEEVRDGNEKIITRNGESYVALIDARRRGEFQQHRKATPEDHRPDHGLEAAICELSVDDLS